MALARVVGVGGAVLLGLGSILGTGIFVSFGVAAGVAGHAVIFAVALAALLAAANGLASAQLAAAHPVSGGTYEYGYRFLHPTAGFVAGVTFLIAKSASAATAALGFAGYLVGGSADLWIRVGIAVGAILALTLVVAGGLKRSSRINAVIVLVTTGSLAAFVFAGVPQLEPAQLRFDASLKEVAEASALMFVAYTGYGRIATLGEEVKDPAKSIPRAIVLALLAALVLYLSVSAVALSLLGKEELAKTSAPLEAAAATLRVPAISTIVRAGAVTAMLGVLLNLILGLSRVYLAMARRRDLPAVFAREHEGSPRLAVLLTGAVILLLALFGDVKTTWSVSAFSVLVYYALTNLAALKLPPEQRRFPRAISVGGLAGCLALAPWVEPLIWGTGLGLLAICTIGHVILRSGRASSAPPDR